MWHRTLLFSSAIVLSSCDWALPPGDQTSPEYWSDFFLDKYADELVVGDLEPGPPRLEEPRTVLLITGVTIRAQWFDPIVARLERDGFIPVVYEPPDLLTYDLFEASEDLAEVVQQVLEESGQERIDILAECTGGVIARHYIQSLGGDQYVSRMVTFVSPQNGIDKAPMAAAIAGWPALYDLSPGSEFLAAVNDVPLPDDVTFTSIYTCSDEYIQPYETSIIPGATNIGLCDEFVGHFQTFYDPEIYLIMHTALTEPTIHDVEPEVPGETPADDDALALEPVASADERGTDGNEEAPPSQADDSPAGEGEAPALEAPSELTAGGAPDGMEPATVTEYQPDENEMVGCNAAGSAASPSL
jgi:hypothetical protein